MPVFCSVLYTLQWKSQRFFRFCFSQKIEKMKPNGPSLRSISFLRCIWKKNFLVKSQLLLMRICIGADYSCRGLQFWHAFPTMELKLKGELQITRKRIQLQSLDVFLMRNKLIFCWEERSFTPAANRGGFQTCHNQYSWNSSQVFWNTPRPFFRGSIAVASI